MRRSEISKTFQGDLTERGVGPERGNHPDSVCHAPARAPEGGKR